MTRCAVIDCNAEQCHPHHSSPRDRHRVRETPQRLPPDTPAGDEEEHHVAKRGQNRRSAQPVGKSRIRRPAGESRRAPRQGGTRDITKIMRSIREECRRMRGNPVPIFDDHKAEVEGDPAGKRSRVIDGPSSVMIVTMGGAHVNSSRVPPPRVTRAATAIWPLAVAQHTRATPPPGPAGRPRPRSMLAVEPAVRSADPAHRGCTLSAR